MVGAALFALYGLCNDQALVGLIPEIKSSQSPLGLVREVRGEVLRKLISDSLLLPIKQGAILYEGDLVVTNADEFLEFNLSEGGMVRIEPNAILRLRKIDEKLALDLIKGSLSTHFIKEQWIYVRRGVREQLVQVYKGHTSLKAHQEGLELTADDSDQMTERMMSAITEPIRAQVVAQMAVAAMTTDSGNDEASMRGRVQASPTPIVEETVVDNSPVSVAIPPEIKKAGENEMPLILPHPENKIVYLLQETQKLRFASRPLCEEICELTVLRNKKMVAKQGFTKGQVPVLEVLIEASGESSYEWSFKDNGQTENFEFKVLPFSEQNLQKTLQQNLNLEIL